MVAQVTEYAVQARRVQFRFVYKQQDEEAGEGLLVQQVTALQPHAAVVTVVSCAGGIHETPRHATAADSAQRVSRCVETTQT